MSEFNNRIAAQRDVLKAVNGRGWQEELFGLSHGAIERWARQNHIGEDAPLLRLVKVAADKLFFLSNKSQEQVTDEYRETSTQVGALIAEINRCVSVGSHA
jgi:hypothetical protein